MFTTDIINRTLNETGIAFAFKPAVVGKSVIDSRIAEKNDLFFAFAGEKVDGHSFIPELLKKGVFCIGSEKFTDKNYCQVPDVRLFMAKLASIFRTISGKLIIGVTGSSGKTTTREFIAAMLKISGFEVYSTAGNLNNDIGLPLTLLNTPPTSTHIVLEMGMNHSGEIKYLADIATPDFGVITNIGFAHIGNFESRDGVAAAKLELFDCNTTYPIANIDDSFVMKWVLNNKERKVITYSFSGEKANFKVISRKYGKLSAQWHNRFYSWELPLMPDYMEENFLTAAAVSLSLGANPDKLSDSLKNLSIPKFRGEVIKIGNRVIKSDCYNANPDSMMKSIEGFLKIYSNELEPKTLVLGQMAELGSFSDYFHIELVNFLKNVKNVQAIILVGELYKEALKNVKNIEYIKWVDDAPKAVDFIPENGYVLLKGSRSARLERIIDNLTH